MTKYLSIYFTQNQVFNFLEQGLLDDGLPAGCLGFSEAFLAETLFLCLEILLVKLGGVEVEADYVVFFLG